MKVSLRFLGWWFNVAYEGELILQSFISEHPAFLAARPDDLNCTGRRIAEALELYEKTGVFECLKFEVDYSRCSDFDRKVYDELRRVPSGSLITYRDLAGRIGNPRAARAVGQSMKRNRFQIFVP